MIDWNARTAVVTGASSGIGQATAERLAREGLDLVLVARRRSRLQALASKIRAAGGRARILVADLTRESERRRVWRDIRARSGGADILVNNAGFGWYGRSQNMSWKTARRMLQVNVEAVVQFSLGFLKDGPRNGFGHIINIGSISGSLPSQGIALYGATKSFLDNFSTALHRELKGSAVQVSLVRAGPVRTEFGQAALRDGRGLHVPTERLGVTSAHVADRVWDLVRRPRRVIYIPRWLWVVPWIEMAFGWLIDGLGPLLLRRQHSPGSD
jgi:uncharacterized protein